MAKLIDIENATFSWKETDKEGYGEDFIGGVLFALDALTAKEEDIVRCKDCESACPVDDKGGLVCTIWGANTEANRFCSEGERKETT